MGRDLLWQWFLSDPLALDLRLFANDLHLLRDLPLLHGLVLLLLVLLLVVDFLHVLAQSVPCDERRVALLALVPPLPSVLALVPNKGVLVAEPHGALVARELLLSVMGLKM